VIEEMSYMRKLISLMISLILIIVGLFLYNESLKPDSYKWAAPYLPLSIVAAGVLLLFWTATRLIDTQKKNV